MSKAAFFGSDSPSPRYVKISNLFFWHPIFMFSTTKRLQNLRVRCPVQESSEKIYAMYYYNCVFITLIQF